MNKKIPTFYALCFILFAIFCIIMVSVFFRLNPTKSVMTENKTEPIIVIDAGHGGEDGGAVSESGVLEKDINLSIANNSADLLKIFGYKVVQFIQKQYCNQYSPKQIFSKQILRNSNFLFPE